MLEWSESIVWFRSGQQDHLHLFLMTCLDQINKQDKGQLHPRRTASNNWLIKHARCKCWLSKTGEVIDTNSAYAAWQRRGFYARIHAKPVEEEQGKKDTSNMNLVDQSSRGRTRSYGPLSTILV